MSRKQKIMLALVAGHLALVTYNAFVGVLPLPLPSEHHPAGWPIRWYAAMSGSNNSYGFFKRVDNTCQVTFVMVDAEGNSWTDFLSNADNHEAEMRFNGSPFMLPDYGDALATSWAATMFGRHPRAERVDVNFIQYNPVDMDEFRAGERPKWTLTYQRIFLRKAYLEKAAQEK